MNSSRTDAQSEPQPWVAGLADAILALGTPLFWDRLTLGIGALLENHGAVVFRYQARREPAFVFSDYRDQLSRSDFRQYRTRAYLLDPFYLAYLERKPGGVHTLRDLAADRFFSSEYHRTYYVQTGLVDEAGVFCWIKPDDLVIISLARRTGAPTLSASSVRELRSYAPLVTSLVRRHVAIGQAAGAEPGVMPNPGKAGMELQFGDDDALTQRETAIANLILRGHSSPSIALLLGISVDTVKVHRRHIYRKLNISSQAELFSLAMNRVIASE
ncbi:helix-turn-helix transcriptional regulator [Rhizobium sp. KVB221]|uniref:Helix-turn-helix transcriptional regulator n=1 Tax=Rhizobium setariae TaxID=2801340 RepID=A0A936YUX6_9HYPH|nr:helix-turn-helix transcriptional regulator [Rhizobium setariae]MBL0373876.1 helix-turn-helix transcriptional regulator [Rhizobium setariae]